MSKLLKGTKPLTRVSGSYSLLRPMGNPRGTKAYTKHNEVYALYDFSTDISSSGLLPDLGPNGFHLGPSGSSSNHRPAAPVKISGPSFGTDPVASNNLVSNFALGFPTHETEFTDSVSSGTSLESITVDNNNFTFSDEKGDKPFSISAWYSPDETIGTGYIASKYKTTNPKAREWVFGQSNTYDLTLFVQFLDEDKDAYLSRYSEFGVLTQFGSSHVVITYDGSGDANGINFYVNGVLRTGPILSNDSSYVQMRNTTAPFIIGNRANATNMAALDGKLAQLCVWETELKESDVSTLYKARLGVTKFGSGFVSLPPRVQIREIDQQPGAFSPNIVTGDPDFQKTKVKPFNDNDTITFHSSYGKAKISFFNNVKDGDFIDLTGSNGKYSKRFMFLNNPSSPNRNDQNENMYLQDFSFDPPMFFDSPQYSSDQFTKSLRKPEIYDNLNIDHKIGSKIIQRINADGEPLEFPETHIEVELTHKEGTTGSFKQGNLITVGRLDPEDPPVMGVKQFHIGTTQKLNYSSRAPIDGFRDESSLVPIPNFLPTIETSGTISPGFSDRGSINPINFSHRPFVENRIEVRNNSEFDRRGSHPSIIRGFAGSTKSKTAIVLQMNSKNSEGDSIYFSTGSPGPAGTFDPTIANTSGSGMAYWSPQMSCWQQLDLGLRRDNVSITSTSDPFSSNDQVRVQSCLGFSLVSSSSFSPTADKSEVFFRDSTVTSPSHNSHNLKVIESGRGFGVPVSQYSFPWGAQYNASGSQVLDMSKYLSSPFLVEKMRVHIDGVFGVGTTNEHTTNQYPVVKHLFILNQSTNGDDPHVRELLNVGQSHSDGAGSLVTSSTQNARLGSREILTWSKIGFVRSDNFLIRGAGKALKKANIDFDKLYSFDPSLISSNKAHLTASFSFDLNPKMALSSKALSVHHKRKGTNETSKKNTTGLVVSNQHGGSNLLGEVSGRQIASSLGSLKNSSSGSSITFDNSSGIGDLFAKNKPSKISPFLLHPSDRLIVGWQNIQMRNKYSSDKDCTLNEQVEADQFVDKIKSVKIVLYGSQIRDSREYHNYFHQSLTTHEISTTIVGDPVVDQFDVEPMLNLSGSGPDALFFGKMKVDGTTSVRGRRASIAKGEAGSTGSLSRNVAFHNESVRWNDTLAPPISHVLKDKTFFPTPVSLKTDVTIDSVPYPALVLSIKPSSPSSKIVSKIGVFAEKAFLDTTVIDTPKSPLVSPGGGPVTSAKALVFDLEPSDGGGTDYKIYGGSKEHIKGVTSFGSPEAAKPASSDIISLKGAADPIEVAKLSSIFWAGPAPKPGKKMFPIFPLTPHKLIPLIKCWKYGFWSGIPMSPKTYFRRDHFGYFRDLIEQPVETFTQGLVNEETGEAIFGWPDNGGPVKVRFFSRSGTPDIDPLDTNTHNLSTFATSSLPYYDGQSLERDVVNDPPPDLTDKTGIEEAVLAITEGDA